MKSQEFQHYSLIHSKKVLYSEGMVSMSVTTKFLRNLILLIPALYTKYQQSGFGRLNEIFSKYYEKEFRFLHLLWTEPRDIKTVVDVGVNRGQSSRALSLNFPLRELHVFEPLSAVLENNLEGLKKQNANIYVHAVGLAAASSVKTLVTPIYRGIPFWGLSSFDKKHYEKFLNQSNIWKFDQSHLVLHETHVENRTLDEYELSPDFIKIDVEGFELEVLAGSIATIKRCRPTVLVETTNHLERIRAFFGEFHYQNLELIGRAWVLSEGKKMNQLFIPI
jgi:FkbM family methyltransferase